jgi:3',5'-cyclic AMP phosphodiesterase CpdA
MPLIAQLTDLHVHADGALAYGRVDTLGHLHRAVDHLNALPLDGIVITGDLIDDGRGESYATLRPALDRLAAPWWPLPGNHDGPDFWPVFADRMTDPTPGLGHVALLKDVRIVCHDTTVPGAAGGRIDDARADWLASTLPGEQPAILALHHPPVPTGIAHMDRIGLAGADRLAEIVADHPPLAILAGHIHRTILARLGAVPVIVGPSPAHAVTLDLDPDAPGSLTMEPPGVLLHQIGPHGLRTHLSLIGDHPGPYPFAGFDPGV